MNDRKRLVLLFFMLLVSNIFAWSKDLQKQFDTAVYNENYDEVLSLGEDLTRQLVVDGKPEDASLAYREMASVCFFRGEFLKAIRYCIVGLRLLKEADSPVLMFKHTSTIGESYNRISMPDSAGYWLMKSEELVSRYSVILDQARPFVKALYNSLGVFHLQHRDPYQAKPYYEKALEMAKQDKNSRAIGIAYNSLANYHNDIADYAQAEVYYQQAITYFDHESVDHSWILISLSNNKYKQNVFDQALSYATQSIELYRRVLKKRPGSRHILLEKRQSFRLGACYHQLGRLEEAKATYRKVLQMLEEEGNSRSEEAAYCYLGLGDISQLEGNTEAALFFYQKGLMASSLSFSDKSFQQNPIAEDVLSSRALIDILMQKAICLEKVGGIRRKEENYREAAFETYLRAIDEAEKMRKNMSMAASKILFAEKLRPIFDNAIALGYQLSNGEQEGIWVEKIADLSERSRRVVLSDILHESHIRPHSVPPGMLKEEIRLRRDIANSRTHLVNNSDHNVQDSISKSLQNMQIAHRKLLRQMELNNPAYVAQRHGTPSVNLESVRAELGKESAYLAYYLTNSHYYVYVITRRKVWASRFLIPDDFYVTVERLQRSAATDPLLYSFDGIEAAERLHALLIQPVYEQVAGYKSWLVARDGPLNLIPFEILRNKEDRQLILARHAISYLHSAELIVSNKRVKKNLTNTLGFAPYHQPYHIDSVRWLPYTEKEVQETSNLLFLGPQATKQQLFRVIGQADALHLATHAEYNDSIPENSYVSFFPDNSDYKLYAHEIANLPLQQVRLAILSFCDADRGKVYNGEGVLSLARAFQLAGCPGILATLWKADDQITSYIVEAFYRHLKTGKSPDLALRDAKLDYFSSELGYANNHPFYWGNLVYIGDTAPVFTTAIPFAQRIIYYLAPGVFLLLAVSFYYVRRRTKAS